MDFKIGNQVKYTRSSGSKCSGTVFKIDGDSLWIRSQCGNVKRHKSQVTIK